MSEKHDISLNVLRVIISKAWSDPTFKAKLLADATGTLATLGVQVPRGVTVKFAEDSASVWHFVIPAQDSVELTDEQLGKVAGGMAPHIIGGALPVEKPK